MRLEDRQETLKMDETGTLIAADKVQGTDIYDSRGDNLGEVESVMIDKRSGKVAYAVVAFGGFLGIGARRRALPWDALTYDIDLGGYVINADDEVLWPRIGDSADTDAEPGDDRRSDPSIPRYWQ